MSDTSEDMSSTPAQVARLLQHQVPQWAHLSLRPVQTTGTDNALFRLGEGLVVRMPRRESAVALLHKELDWLPHLQGLPLAVPNLRYRGRAEALPRLDFGIFDWMEGKTATAENLADWQEAAVRLAEFLRALHKKDTKNAPLAGVCNSRRGVTLRRRDGRTRPAIDVLSDEIDAAGAHALWQAACAEVFDGSPVWLHGDLKADNMIARDGALHGIIDWGLSAVGDPAADYAAAWSWINPSARQDFRECLSVSEHDWLRAKGWALYGAVIALSYYRDGKNEALCRQSRQTLFRLGLLL